MPLYSHGQTSNLPLEIALDSKIAKLLRSKFSSLCFTHLYIPFVL
jgi:hypothetical protein